MTIQESRKNGNEKKGMEAGAVKKSIKVKVIGDFLQSRCERLGPIG